MMELMAVVGIIVLFTGALIGLILWITNKDGQWETKKQKKARYIREAHDCIYWQRRK